MKTILFSGGLDSLVAARYCNPDTLLFCRIGNRYGKQEHQAAMKLAVQLGKPLYVSDFVDLSKYEHADAHIPMRNMFLLMMGAMFGIEQGEKHLELVLTVQKDEMSIPDRSLAFFLDAGSLLSMLLECSVVVSTPFVDMDKTDMVSWYLSNGFPVEDLLVSRSCFNITDDECGDCPACFRKWVALANNGVYSARFIVNPKSSATANTYMMNLAKYSEHRQKRILDVMK